MGSEARDALTHCSSIELYLPQRRVDAGVNRGGDRLSLMVFAVDDGEVPVGERIERAAEGHQIDRMAEQRRRLNFSFSHAHANQHFTEVVGPLHIERTTKRNAAPGTKFRHDRTSRCKDGNSQAA